MRKSRSSGSVGERGGNDPLYPDHVLRVRAVFRHKNVWFYNSGCVREFQEKNRVLLARILVIMLNKGILCKITRDTLIRNFPHLNTLDY